MYINILKKDLKRKKTMNAIVLLFMILASMFVSSSVNNIIAVFGGLDNYFEKAGMSDYFIAVMNQGDYEPANEFLDDIDIIDEYGVETGVFMTEENVNIDISFNTIAFPFESAQINYFDENNNVITEVKKGEVWLSSKIFAKTDLKAGDMFSVKVDDFYEEFTIAGSFKDVTFGSEMMGNSRCMFNQEDFDKFKDNFKEKSVGLYYITTDKPEDMENEISDLMTAFKAPAATIKLTYAMDMIIAGILLVVSVLLIVTAFIVLRFTISFTLSEEFREIGVMKAIGIRNFKIRFLYIVKYLALAIIGASIGFFASIPFGNMLLKSVSGKLVLESGSNILINLICSLIVVAIILLFCYSCTRKVVKCTPLDAIRSGQTGERYRKKSVIRIGKSKLNTCGFLALNDVLSSPKRYLLIIFIIMLCLAPVLIVSNASNTLANKEILSYLGAKQSDVYMNPDKDVYSYENGKELALDKIETVEKKLADNNMPAEISFDIVFTVSLKHGDNVTTSTAFQGLNAKASDYTYHEGTAPQNKYEIAVTPVIADKLGASIGDTVTLKTLEGEQDVIITALYQSMNNLGESVRMHEDLELNYIQSTGYAAFQTDFTDNPDEAEIADRIERLKDMFDTDDVWTATEYAVNTIGVGDSMGSISSLILILAMIVAALVAVLMERSFIDKERSEVALLKAIGFKSSSVISQHVLRMSIASLIAVVLTSALSIPITKLAFDPIFKTMGLSYGMNYSVNPIEIFVIYPVAILIVMVIFTFFSALYTKKIKTSEVSGIE